MKLILHSSAPWTPDGQQTAILARRLKAAGHDLLLSALGLQGLLEWEGIPVYGTYQDPFGSDVIAQYADRFFGDLKSGWVITNLDLAQFRPASQMHVASWLSVDHHPVSPSIVKRLNDLDALPISMSKWGQEKLNEEGFEARYVPQGVDTKVFVPHDQREAKAALGLPDVFVVGVVAPNRLSAGRKGLAEAMEGFARFHETHPSAILLMHTEADDIAGGLHLGRMAESFGIKESVRFRDRLAVQLGVSPQVMAVTYSAMDVLLHSSYGEGSGGSIVEAQACGVPVIVTDFSAMPEFCGAGWTVKGDVFYDHNDAWIHKPRVDGIVEALEFAFTDAEGYRGMAWHIARRFDADYIFEEYWKPVLTEMEARL